MLTDIQSGAELGGERPRAVVRAWKFGGAGPTGLKAALTVRRGESRLLLFPPQRPPFARQAAAQSPPDNAFAGRIGKFHLCAARLSFTWQYFPRQDAPYGDGAPYLCGAWGFSRASLGSTR
jgi:hypothetical protein